jgi:hypothetical protein
MNMQRQARSYINMNMHRQAREGVSWVDSPEAGADLLPVADSAPVQHIQAPTSSESHQEVPKTTLTSGAPPLAWLI